MNLLIGDSHIKCLYQYRNDNNIIQHYSASSIRGLLNQKSKSGAILDILHKLNSGKYNKLFIMFGKVDLEWVYPFKCRTKNININDFINETINKYFDFLNEISSFVKNIYILGIHLPSCDNKLMLTLINGDECKTKGINDVITNANIDNSTNKLNKLKKIDDLELRTEHIIKFNKIIEEKVKNFENYSYIDITDELINNNTNIIKNEYIVINDHHLKKEETGKIWFDKYLKKLL